MTAPAAPVPGPSGTLHRPTGQRRMDRAERVYRTAALFIKPVLRAWFRVSIETVPGGGLPEGGVILVANHRSNLDPPLLSLVTDRPVRFMAKQELFKGPFGAVLRLIGQFPVRRGGADRRALEDASRVVAGGGVLGLFPEGTRGEGRFERIQPGLVFLVLRTGCPIVPVAILGTERARRRFGWLPGVTRVRLVVGRPLDLPAVGTGRAGRRAATEHLHQALREFIATHDPVPADRSGRCAP